MHLLSQRHLQLKESPDFLDDEEIIRLADVIKTFEEGVAPREKESPKPIQPESKPSPGPGVMRLEDLPKEFQAEAAAALEALSGGAAFNIDADLGPAAPSKKSDITKSQDKNNCE